MTMRGSSFFSGGYVTGLAGWLASEGGQGRRRKRKTSSDGKSSFNERQFLTAGVVGMKNLLPRGKFPFPFPRAGRVNNAGNSYG